MNKFELEHTILKKEFIQQLFKEHQDAPKCAAPSVVEAWFKNFIGILFPGFCNVQYTSQEQLNQALVNSEKELFDILLCNDCLKNEQIIALANDFFNQVENIKNLLQKDIQALYDGDPAAKSFAEIIRSYPGFYAISAHRVAHQLYKMNVQLIPRIISENAHSKTGVDIHPGATIGEYFCIDHGTGVVIGETTTVGNNVKIYQGVTLGALSVENRNIQHKRHPTIEDGVIIYAGATILGGNTIVGKNSIVGGGVWLTKSTPENSKVYYRARMSNAEGEIDTITFKP